MSSPTPRVAANKTRHWVEVHFETAPQKPLILPVKAAIGLAQRLLVAVDLLDPGRHAGNGNAPHRR